MNKGIYYPEINPESPFDDAGIMEIVRHGYYARSYLFKKK